LKSDGSVWAWGLNGDGQLGDNTLTQRSVPVQTTVITNVSGIDGGGYHSLAIMGDGTVWGWGRNGNGQLGDGTTTGRLSPVPVSSLSQVAAVAGGGFHSLAVQQNPPTLYSWGKNQYGELGDGSTTDKHAPVSVSGFGL